ncbi:hypothetical protein PSYPI_47398, partial [Pseudomonas syringae pv. pisi str. 1704B]
PVHSSMSYKGAKVGFRLCYVANADVRAHVQLGKAHGRAVYI